MRNLLLSLSLLSLACDGGALHADAGTDAGEPIVLADAGSAAATCPEGEPLTDLAGKPVFVVNIDGADYRFVWDTGAPTSVVDVSRAGEIGPGPHVVVIAGQTLAATRFEPVDLARIGIDGIDGVVGTDVLGDAVVTIDASRRRYWVDSEFDGASLSACAHATGAGTEVEYVRNSYLFVPGRMEDLDGWFLVDTGASLGATPDGVFDQLDAARPRPALGGFYTPAGIGTFWARLTTLDRYEVAGHGVERIVTRTLPDDLLPSAPSPEGGPLLGVLPSLYLRHFLFTVDYRRGVIRLDPFVGDPLREPPGFYATGIALEESVDPPIRVAQVLAGSAAEDEGVAVGDEVLSVRGFAIETLTPSERPWAFVSRAPGDLVEVVIRQGDVDRALMLEARDLL